MEKRYQIFISYKRDILDKDGAFRICKKEGSELARAIYDWFVYRGYFTFLDEEEMKLGDRWPNQIENAVNQSDIFLLILTDNTVNSEEVIKEVKLALKRDKKKCILLSQRPELLEERGKVPVEEWQQLSQWQGLSYHDFIDEKGSVDSKALCERLEQTIVDIGIYGNRYAINLLEKLPEEEFIIPEGWEREMNNGYTVIGKADEYSRYFIVRQSPSGVGVIDGLLQVVIPFEYIEISSFQNGLARAKNKRGWGIVNMNNETVIPFGLVDELDRFGESRIYKEGKCGYLNKYNQMTVPIEYDDIEGGDGVYYAKKNGFWGIIDKRDVNLILIPFEYDEIGHIIDNTVRVKKGTKVMIIDICNRQLLSYDDIIVIEDALFIVKKSNLWGIVDKENQVRIPIIYEEIKQCPYQRKLFMARGNGKWSLIDKENKRLIDSEFEDVSPEVLEWSVNMESGRAIIAKKDGKWGVVDIESGEAIVPHEYDYICPDIQHNAISREVASIITQVSGYQSFIKVQQGHLWGLYSPGFFVLPCVFDNIDESIITRIPFYRYKEEKESESLEWYEPVIVKVRKNDKWGILHIDDQSPLSLLVPFEYDEIIHVGYEPFFRAEWTYISNNGDVTKAQGLLSYTGDRICTIVNINVFWSLHNIYVYPGFDLEDGRKNYDGYQLVRSVSEDGSPGDKWGAIKNGAVVIPIIFDGIKGVMCDGTAVVNKNGKWGAVRYHSEGLDTEDINKLEELVPFIYDDGYALSEGLICFCLHDHTNDPFIEERWGVTTPEGMLLVDFKYTKITRSDNNEYVGVVGGVVNLFSGKFFPFGVYRYNKDDKFALIEKYNDIGEIRYGLIDKDGGEIFPPKFDYICNCPTDEGYFYVRLNGKWQFRDSENEEITPWREGRLDLSTIA